ncbi:MAG: type I DNA topoisomerase [Oscillospiraceae bacterium]|jgi:DNA topoisomerase-1|nr:type I DNA topoisomerase [Oscillospiraceae bacterium]
MAFKNLVIVESPSKAKTIGKYLGSDYLVTASLGHLRDLPKSKLGVDIEADFAPAYEPVKGSEKTISELRSAAKTADLVYLATDPDREGEAISWHLKELLGLSDERALRVTFNEITKRVVQDSILHPRKIDQDLVDAQQARRVLDRIVGYQLSPLLWKKIRRGLSAGRVQSVTVRIVTDREEEIRAFVPEEYWYLDALLSPKADIRFAARYQGTVKKKESLRSAEDVEKIISETQNSPFIVREVKLGDKKRSPSPPFITSSLQQEASRKLGMTPRRAMSIAQQLYEGVDIRGEGTVGLITYMRTDSLRLSEDALGEAAELIKSRYGNAYYPGQPTRYKTKAGAQDAHEAIRPSNPSLAPDEIKQNLTQDQYRLYKLIWSRYLASQMSPAVYDSVTVDAESAGYVFRANHTAVKFPGFMAVYVEGADEDEDISDSPLPNLQAGNALTLINFKKEQKFTQPPPRYTEATLIKAMEDSGIGRPSTYAPTISTIIDRRYVKKDGKMLVPTPLGETVTNKFLKEWFSDIVNIGFTAEMEKKLDDVESGAKDWRDVLREFYDGENGLASLIKKAEDAPRVKLPVIESEEICEKCGRKMVVRTGKFGDFLGCPGFPDCDFTMPIVEEMPGKCPRCGDRILKRTGRSKKNNKEYTYYACESYKECGFTTFDVPVEDNCTVCGQTMFKKSGRGRKTPYCINAECSAFVPEDKRGFGKTSGASAAPETKTSAATAKTSAAKPAAAKRAGTKPTAAKRASAKPAAKKPAAVRTAVKKPKSE